MTTQTQVPHLLSSVQLGNLNLKNRVAMAPLTRARSGVERIPNKLMAQYYSQRAASGLIVSEATSISPQGNGWQNSPGIYTPEQVAGWKDVVEAVHQAGGVIFLQLWHTGRASHPSFQIDNQLPVAPSAIKIEGSEAHTAEGPKPFVTPRELSTEEISQVVEQYLTAAKNAKAAGFDGVEIHGANGYLIDQFLQSKTNQRTDNQQLNDYKLGYLHVMDGLGFGFHELGEPVTLSEIRKVYDGILMGNCGYDRHTAEKAIAENNADLIAFGRPYISNPDLVARFANNWELNPDSDPATWYSFEAEGYTDFPTYEESQVSA